MGDWRLVAAAALAGLLAACAGSSSEPDASPTIPVATPSPTPTPTPPPEDPYAIPDEIDEAYLDRVFEALERVIGDATRLIVAQKSYPPEADDLYMEVYGPEALQVVRDGWIEELVLDPELAAWHDPPGDKAVDVQELIHTDDDCVFVQTNWDFTGVLRDPTQQVVYVLLRPREPTDANPTPWFIARQAQLAEGAGQSGRNLCE